MVLGSLASQRRGMERDLSEEGRQGKTRPLGLRRGKGYCCMPVMGHRFPWPQYDRYEYNEIPWGQYIFIGPLHPSHGYLIIY